MSSSRRRSSVGAPGAPASSATSSEASTIQNGNSSDSIKVLCRFRPLLNHASEYDRRESARRSTGRNGPQEVYRIDEERNEVEFLSDLSDGKSFKFDKVFGAESSQPEVFKEVQSTVNSVMDGFNGTIMAYGQTSAGKSYTMEGLSLWDPNSQGVIPRCVDALFDEINKSDSMIQFQVVLSFYEIYCEKIRDLLNPAQVNLKIRETRNNGFIVQDITEVYCTDRESILRVIEVGKANRASAPTLMNAESSRSHSIVSILVDQKNMETGRNKRGILFLVDLAGSEKVSKTGASGMRLEEAKNINSSLTTLGMVINSLCDGASHVPYRDSKLTMILTDALGGNSKTTLIICCNPDFKHAPETISTLRFGERAKKIKNNARINEEFSVEELKALLAAARKEIYQLKQKLKITDGSYDEATLSRDLEDQDSQNPAREEELRSEIAILRQRLLNLEEELEMERLRFKEEQEQRLLLATESEALKNTITEMEEKLLKSALTRKRTESFESGHSPKGVRKPSRPSIFKVTASTDSIFLNEEEEEGYALKNGNLESPLSSNDHQNSAEMDEIEEVLENIKTKRSRDSLHELNEQGRNLNIQLEDEIKGLNKSIQEQQHEAKTAQVSAQGFAEKYTKLREEYELHVQRLMLKLTQEQQARTIIEDKLEDAYLKLWQNTGRTSSKNRGFFATWFGYNAHNKKEEAPYPPKDKPDFNAPLSDREQTISRSLDLAQSRVAQLVAELEATKEAQMIVLETKEAVMRSLARQNCQLTVEKDGLNKKVEELSHTVDQLTMLLRNVQLRSHSKDSHHHHHHHHSSNNGGAGFNNMKTTNTIKGGYHSSLKDKKESLIDRTITTDDNDDDERQPIEVIL